MPLECKQPKKVLLLMKIFLHQYVHLLCKSIVLPIICSIQVLNKTKTMSGSSNHILRGD